MEPRKGSQGRTEDTMRTALLARTKQRLDDLGPCKMEKGEINRTAGGGESVSQIRNEEGTRAAWTDGTKRTDTESDERKLQGCKGSNLPNTGGRPV